MRHFRFVVPLALLALLLVSCGGDDSDGASSIETTATDFAFSPDAWTVTAGEEFSIEFTNDGTQDHEWAVVTLGDDITSEDEFAEDIVLLEVEAIGVGESTTQSFTIDEAGTYQVICALDGHFNSGMEGSLTVS